MSYTTHRYDISECEIEGVISVVCAGVSYALTIMHSTDRHGRDVYRVTSGATVIRGQLATLAEARTVAHTIMVTECLKMGGSL